LPTGSKEMPMCMGRGSTCSRSRVSLPQFTIKIGEPLGTIRVYCFIWSTRGRAKLMQDRITKGICKMRRWIWGLRGLGGLFGKFSGNLFGDDDGLVGLHVSHDRSRTLALHVHDDNRGGPGVQFFQHGRRPGGGR